MKSQHKITKKHKLLDENGFVTEPGYSTELVLDYNRNDIKASKFRIKEWDYYYIGNQKHAIAMTVADNSYMALISVTLFDFLDRKQLTKTIMVPFTMGKLNLPNTSTKGLTAFKNKNVDISFNNDGKVRHLKCSVKDFTKGKDLSADIKLTDFPKDTMVIATPFAEDKKAFYYNQKINCMKASGSISYGDMIYDLKSSDSLGTLDWGRGVWTYQNTWYWGSLSTVLSDGKKFGFNIGYGFGDTSAASENMLFYEGKAHKLSQVEFKIPKAQGKDDFMSPWKFTSDDKRFEMDFTPVLDRHSYDNFLVIKSDQHQVFGKFSGKAVLDNGEVIELKDCLGFAEKVFNRF